MADIVHNFPIKAPTDKVFEAITTPNGLDSWWTLTCKASAGENAVYKLGFGPGYDWRARCTRWKPDSEFELTLVEADDDWSGTKVSFEFVENDGATEIKFQHQDWPVDNDHYRISCFCWAMYLRLLKRYVEFGEIVPYEQRLDV